MSYRSFKRLLGETSLERKCLFLFGTFILLLLAGSFFLYAYLTESMLLDQAKAMCRLLVHPILADSHLKAMKDKHLTGNDLREAIGEMNQESNLLGELKDYTYSVLKENQVDVDPSERDLFKEFGRRENPLNEKHRESRSASGELVMLYYAPLRESHRCAACHQKVEERELARVAENDVRAVLRIRLPIQSIREGMHTNRAILLSLALVTALLIMTGSYVIIRYVIVKPVKHLKEVSDAISAGELNVRSEIQTGDEFEDLSHAFNRMLRNLVSMQDQWRKVNADLDLKVEELARVNMALYESNRLKSDFLATMSHELRTPLNSILGFSEVLLSGNRLSDKQHRWVNNIQTSGEKLLNLINDILDLAKIEAGKMQVRLENFSVHDVCEGLLNMFRPLAEKKNIDLRSQIAPDIPVMRQDVTKLQQILQNLLSNAVKFTPEGGRVLLKAEHEGSQVVLTVTDTGVGIAPEEQDLVFEKFRQSGNPLTREHAGTGLGLSIVRELSILLGGEVSLKSELGRGSTFTVRLPLHLSDESRLDFDLADERVDLSRATRLDVRLYTTPGRLTRLDHDETKVDLPAVDVAPPVDVRHEEFKPRTDP
jgi:signal transduction histidine kinase